MNRATAKADVGAVIEKLRSWNERLEEAAEEKRRTGVQAIGPEDREELRRYVADVWHQDCEWFPLIGGVEGTGSYRGRDGVLAFYEDFWGAFEVTYEDHDFRPLGDAVVHLSSMSLRARESGVELRRELGIVYEVDGELIRRGRAYDSHAAAFAAAEELRA